MQSNLWCMMVAMSSTTVLTFCATLASVGTGSAVLSELNAASGTSFSFAAMIARFLAFLALGVCGIYAARQCDLRGSLIVTSEDRGRTVRDFMIYGVLPGFVLGVINYLLFFRHRYSPLVRPEIRNMETFYDSFLLSIDAAVGEEIIFRLFIVSALFFFLRQMYAKIFHLWPSLVSLLPVALALVVSSLLFALAHDIYGFTAAFWGGLVLGVIYVKGGIESAIAAHFVANFLFFSASYLS